MPFICRHGIEVQESDLDLHYVKDPDAPMVVTATSQILPVGIRLELISKSVGFKFK